jgi:general secretion pathway protein G
MRKKRAFTLLEIMIVIFIIGLIGSVIGYNMRGSLDEGRAFKSREGIERLLSVFELEIAKGNTTAAQLVSSEDERKDKLEKSGLIKDPVAMLKDGWGKPYTFGKDRQENLWITSKNLDAYNEKHEKAK